jgi:hypothetical protein
MMSRAAAESLILRNQTRAYSYRADIHPFLALQLHTLHTQNSPRAELRKDRCCPGDSMKPYSRANDENCPSETSFRDKGYKYSAERFLRTSLTEPSTRRKHPPRTAHSAIARRGKSGTLRRCCNRLERIRPRYLPNPVAEAARTDTAEHIVHCQQCGPHARRHIPVPRILQHGRSPLRS